MNTQTLEQVCTIPQPASEADALTAVRLLKNHFIALLEAYIKMRQRQTIRQKSQYNNNFSILSRFFGCCSADLKCAAARKMIDALGGRKSDFTADEMRALRDSRLGRITAVIEDFGFLPNSFIAIEIAQRAAQNPDYSFNYRAGSV